MLAIIDVQLRLTLKKEEIVRDLIWYDPVDRATRNFKGAALKYEYYEFPDVEVLVPSMGWVKGKTIASPQEVYRWAESKESNLPQIMKWYSDNESDLMLQVEYSDSREVGIWFPKEKDGERRDEVEKSLYAARLRFEIKE